MTKRWCKRTTGSGLAASGFWDCWLYLFVIIAAWQRNPTSLRSPPSGSNKVEPSKIFGRPMQLRSQPRRATKVLLVIDPCPIRWPCWSGFTSLGTCRTAISKKRRLPPRRSSAPDLTGGERVSRVVRYGLGRAAGHGGSSPTSLMAFSRPPSTIQLLMLAWAAFR